MKILFSLLALIVTTKECENKNAVRDANKTEIVNSDKVSQEQKDYIIEYSAISRGIFNEVKISNNSISVQKDRNSKPLVTELNNEMREDLMNKLDGIDITLLPELKAPTEKRLFDGAAHATLKITVDGKIYSTASFDHGFPPEEIKPTLQQNSAVSGMI